MRIKEASNKKDNLSMETRKSLINGGFTLDSLLVMANDFLGRLILSFYGLLLLMISCGLYFGTSLFEGEFSMTNSLTW